MVGRYIHGARLIDTQRVINGQIIDVKNIAPESVGLTKTIINGCVVYVDEKNTGSKKFEKIGFTKMVIGGKVLYVDEREYFEGDSETDSDEYTEDEFED